MHTIKVMELTRPEHIVWDDEGVIRCRHCKGNQKLWGTGAMSENFYQTFLLGHAACQLKRVEKPATQLTAREQVAAQLLTGMVIDGAPQAGAVERASSLADALLKYLAKPYAEDEDLLVIDESDFEELPASTTTTSAKA